MKECGSITIKHPFIMSENNIVAWRLKAGLTESRRAPSAKQRHPNATEKQLAIPRQRI
jgi:hypothetical protein